MPSLQVAQFLSDLDSLFICENQSSALRLVSARAPSLPPPSKTNPLRSSTSSRLKQILALSTPPSAHLPISTTEETSSSDPNLAQAYKLLSLHRDIKQAYLTDVGGDVDAPGLVKLREERERVRIAVAGLGLELGLGEEDNGTRVVHDHDDYDAEEGDGQDVFEEAQSIDDPALAEEKGSGQATLQADEASNTNEDDDDNDQDEGMDDDEIAAWS